ncbi:hypothetical protein ENBRE01_0715 [Enteropsectra breve]|nr:hypothetical protein ENBRE01_0715 [Enteropsectra breve]
MIRIILNLIKVVGGISEDMFLCAQGEDKCCYEMCNYFSPDPENQLSFCCPKCQSISHISCFIESSYSEYRMCLNAQCSMNYMAHDIERIFGLLFYLYVQKDIRFESYNNFYKRCYGNKNSINHDILMDILLRSHMIHVLNDSNNWKKIRKYFEFNEISGGEKFKEYENLFCGGPRGTCEENSGKLKNYARNFYYIQQMWCKLNYYRSTEQCLDVYEEYIERMYYPLLKQCLGDYYIFYFMENPYTLMVLENIYIAKYNAERYELEQSGDNTFNEMIKTIFNICDIPTNMRKIVEYFNGKYTGVFIPIILEYIQLKMNINNCGDVVKAFFSNLRLSLPFTKAEMLVYIKIGALNKVRFDKESVIQVMKWLNNNRYYTSEKDLIAIGDFLKISTKAFSRVEHIALRDFVVENYNLELAKVYGCCMSHDFVCDSFLGPKIIDRQLNG